MASEHEHLRNSIHRLTGMKIEEDKIYLIETRLTDVMRDFKLENFDQLAAKLEAGNDMPFIERVIDKITTHETRFFRDESVFDALVMQIIPEWMERKGITRQRLAGHKLDIWSAGCSTGQEAYSISMMIHEKLPEVHRITQIMGTDISKDTIEKARRAEYTKFEVDRGVPAPLLSRYFENHVENSFRLKDEIKSVASFKMHNLITDPFPGNYDIIFFRNVAIYFPEEQRRGLYEQMRSHLKKDGALILGSAESLSGYLTDYILREHGLARYYELNASLVTIFKK